MKESRPPGSGSLFARLRNWVGVPASWHAIAANTGWLVFDRLIRVLLGLTVGAWIARYLGPSRFGELSYVVAFIALFQAVANLGADGIVVRDLARATERAASILGTALWMRLSAGVVCWLVAIVIMAAIHPADHELILMTLIVGGSLVFQASDTVDLWFQSQTRSRRTVAAKLTAYAVSNGAKALLIALHAPLVAFAWAMSLDFVLAAAGMALAYRGFPTPERWRAHRAMMVELLAECWPFLAAGVGTMLYMRIDQIMLKELLSERDLGFYSAAVPLSQVWNVVPVVLTTSLAPFVARRKIEGEEPYRRALASIFRLYAGCGLIVSLLTSVAAPWIILLLYGKTFERSASVLSIHVLSNVFIYLGIAQGLWIVNERRGRISLYKGLAGAVVSVVGNWFVIPRFGIVGCAVVYVFAQFVAAVASNWVLAPDMLVMQIRGLLFLPPSPRPGMKES
jgi:O-antigen/teichoic acid export membrane protein